MALIDIEFGALASSETLNKNFKFLQDSISEFAQVIETNKASLESQISTVNTNMNGKIDDLKYIVPTGAIFPTLLSNAPDGFLMCRGAEVSRTTYEDLFKIIGTKYGEGDGTTTFNLPNFSNRALYGTSSGTDFGYITAGLPNITGFLRATDSVGSGAFSSSLGGRRPGGSGQGDSQGNYWFDANNGAKNWNSECAGIYGGSKTVQPPAIKVNFIIKF